MTDESRACYGSSRNSKEVLLMGPGPSNCDPRVLRAMSEPTLGHLDPRFLAIMTETMDLLKSVFQTTNHLTLVMPGTGSAGMETSCVNLLEPGDRAIVCVHGVFGERLADVASRCGAEVTVVEAPRGQPVDPAGVRAAFSRTKGVKVLAIVHAETSTGVLQPLDEIVEIAHSNGAMVLVDTVTSLGGVPVDVDRRGFDFVYSGTQKCLSCPPGLAPVTLNDRAAKVVAERKTKVQSWYLDLNMIQRYWGKERFYHHTAPVNMIYALHEAVRIIAEEGLEARFNRHRQNWSALVAGLEAMGLKPFVAPEFRLPSLTTVSIPEGIDDATGRSRLLNEYNIEIGGGLGAMKGKVWRVGLMGHTSRRHNVLLFLSAMGSVLRSMGFSADVGSALAAAEEVYLAEARRKP
ncbi:MAG: alanine--glyoxylate aminotransferase family protein [Firmicutes bacterium]|nr:alanine--glyoxylate aminotransferase family protein [Bacillota bacterium]